LSTLGWYNYKNTTLSSTLTGTLTETQLLQVTIPANTFSASDVIKIIPVFTKVGVAGAITIKIKISTSATMPTLTTGQIATYTHTATSSYTQMSRKMVVNGGNIYGFQFTSSAIDDVTASALTISSVAFDVTQVQYLYVSGTMAPAGTADTFNLRSIQITNV
jgi:hypothetical protein